MQPLFRFLVRFQTSILFVLCVAGSLVLVIKHNDFQRTAFFNAFHNVQGLANAPIQRANDYLALSRENDRLAAENARLLHQLLQTRDASEASTEVHDTVFGQQYICIPARIVHNTTNKQYNYLTLNRGRLNGVTEDMAVIGPDGVVGIVTGSSAHYATVLSLLNRDFSLSAKFVSTQFFGSLTWDGINPHFATLNDIPLHAPVHVGDTLVCSGYSAMFPEGTHIGTVEEFDKDDGNFYNIRVRLASQFNQLCHVVVVKDLLKDEQAELESTFDMHN